MGEPGSSPAGLAWLNHLFPKGPKGQDGHEKKLQNGDLDGHENGPQNGHHNGLQNGH